MGGRRLAAVGVFVLIPVLTIAGSDASLIGTRGVVTGEYSDFDLSGADARLDLLGGFTVKGVSYVGQASTDNMNDPDSDGVFDPFTISGQNPLGATMSGTCGATIGFSYLVSATGFFDDPFVMRLVCTLTVTNANGKTATGAKSIVARGVLVITGGWECSFGACGPEENYTSGTLVGWYGFG